MKFSLHASFTKYVFVFFLFLSGVTKSKAQIINTYENSAVASFSFGGYNADVRPDGLGNVYIADPSNSRILKVNSSGTMTKYVFGLSSSWNNDGIFMTTDPSGNLYISSYDDGTIYKYSSSGVAVTSFTTTFNTSGIAPYGIAYDTKTGTLYVNDGNDPTKLYQYDATTGAKLGTMTIGGAGTIFQIAADPSGNVYLADWGNGKIWKAPYPFGTTATVFAGTGGLGAFTDGAAANVSPLYSPSGVAADAVGNVYITDNGYNCVAMVNTSGKIFRYAGTSTTSGSYGGDGSSPTSANLNDPSALGVDPTTSVVYISDLGNGRIRNVVSCTTPATPSAPAGLTSRCAASATGVYTTAAVSGATSYTWSVTGSGNTVAGTGTAGTVTWGAAFSGTANVSVTAVNTPCSLTSSASITTITVNAIPTGSVINTYVTQTPLSFSNSYDGEARPDGLGNIYIADAGANRIIRKVISSGTETVFVMNVSTSWNNDGIFLATDPTGNLYISSYDDGKIYKYSSSGGPAIATFTSVPAPYGIAYNTKTSLLDVSDGGTNLYQVNPTTGLTVGSTMTITGACEPFQIAADANGNVFLADWCNSKVYKAPFPFGTASSVFASESSCSGVACDAAGNIYIVGEQFNRVLVATPAGVTSAYAGVSTTTGAYSGDGGLPVNAHFNTPEAIAIDPSTGYVYISDQGNGVIRIITPAPTTPATPTGQASRCQGAGTNAYTTSAVTGATSYTWSVTGAGNTVTGTGTAATVTWGAGYSGTASVTVIANATCPSASSSPSSTALSVVVAGALATPSAPSSASTPCKGGTGVYTSSSTGATSYTWSVTGSGNTISGTGTAGSVSWGPSFTGTATISVVATNGVCTTSAASTTVTVNSIPVATTPSGIANRCFGPGSNAFTTTATGANSYAWSVSGSGNTVSGTGSSGNVTWASAFTGVSTVSVTATNGCGTSPAASTTVLTGGLSGTYTVDKGVSGALNLYPNTNTFNSFSSAIASLTSCGLTGPVTFNVISGTVYNESPLTIAFSANAPTATNTLTFVKSGVLANPKINVTGTSNADVGLLINGVSYLTFDGIDITDAGTSSSNYVETGIALARATQNLGCQHDIIRNCRISLNVNDDWTTNSLFNNSIFTPPASPNNFYTTVGIYQVDNLGTQIAGGLDAYPTSAAGTHQFNAFYNNTILNVGVGISLVGNSGYYSHPAGFDFYDGNNTIGIGGGNTITAGTSNSGGEAYGIYIQDQSLFRISNNTITAADNATDWVYGIEVGDNNIITTSVEEIDHNHVAISSSGGTSETYGIRFISGSQSSVSVHDNTLTGSTVTGTPLVLISAGSGATTQDIYGNTINNNTADGEVRAIEFGGGTTANIYNNQVFSNATSGSAGIVSAIYNNGGSVTANISNNFIADLKANTGTNVYGINLTTTTHAKLYYNSIYLNQTTNISAGLNTIGIYIGNNSAATDVDVRNNLVVNTSTAGTGGSGRTVALSLAGLNTTTPKFNGYAAASDYNNYYAGTPGAKNLIFYSATGGVNDQALVGGFQTRVAARDAHSITVNPLFTSTTNLHKTNMTNFMPLIAGIPVSGYTLDIDGDTRNAIATDIGADEFVACPVITTQPVAPVAICSGLGTSVFTVVAAGTPALTYSWNENGLPVANGGVYSGATTATLTLTNPTSALNNKNYTVVVTNGCGSTTSTGAALIINSLPPLAVNPPSAVCTGLTNAILTASGAATYVWAPTANLTPLAGTSATETAQISQLTFYTVTGTGSNSCTASVIVPVATVATGGTISPVYSIICSGGTKLLTVINAAGNNYQWQISTDNNTWTPIAGATNTIYTTNTTDGNTNKYYRLLAQSNSCWNVASTTAEVDVSQPTINITTSALTDNSITLNWGPIGSGNYNISYSGASSGTVLGTTPPKTLTGLTANGNYTITISQTGAGLSGCPASGTASVTTLCAAPPVVNIIGTGTTSITLSWSGGAGNYRVYFRPLYAYNGYFTRDVINGTSTTLTLQGGTQLYHSVTYEIYVTKLDCPTTGNVGQPSPVVYATTTPALACTAPTIDSVRSICPVQIEVWMHGSPTNQYYIDVERLTPTIQPVTSYPVSGSYFTMNVSAGQNYLITARSICGSAVSNMTRYPNALQIKPQCGNISNLLLSNPTCEGFTASWNSDQCIANNASYYQLFMRQVGTINWNSYGVTIPTFPIGPYKVVSWLGRGKTYDVYARAVYSCNGYLTYGATTQTLRITTLSAGCREEEGETEEAKPLSQQTSADNSEVFSFYPNPNSGHFTVDLTRLNTNEDAVRIEVMNMLGQTVVTQLTNISDGHMTELINLPADAAAGTYLVRLTAGKSVYTSKMNFSK